MQRQWCVEKNFTKVQALQLRGHAVEASNNRRALAYHFTTSYQTNFMHGFY